MGTSERKKLTNKQRMFVKEYLVDLNATQAAIRSGYSKKTAKETGYENLTKPHIAEEIQGAMQAREKRTEISADWTLREIHKLASFDARKLYDESGNLKKIIDLDDDTAACIGGIDIQESLLGDVTKKFKIWDKNSALEKMAKHFNMYEENNTLKFDEKTLKAIFENLPPEYLQAIQKKIG